MDAARREAASRGGKLSQKKRSQKKLVLQVVFTEPNGPMKKLLSLVALLAVVGTVLLTGCKQEEAPPTAPTPPSTNAPAAK
jgi:hypothetical protein